MPGVSMLTAGLKSEPMIPCPILLPLLLSIVIHAMSASAQDKGSVDAKPLPPLANPSDPKIGAKELFARKLLPAAMPTKVLGSYVKGCIAGAEPLPITGATWQVMRLSRNRNWAHPDMIALLKRLSVKAHKDAGWPGILVGDMSQPRGGPMLTGHASHQVGLDADVWLTPMPDHLLSRRARGVAGADRNADLRPREPRRLGPLRNFSQGLVQILLDVVTERFERGDVHDLRAIFEAACECLLEQGIETGEEGGERLAGAGGRGDQDVVARRDRRPAAGLHVGGRAEARAEPLRDDRMKPGQGHGCADGTMPEPGSSNNPRWLPFRCHPFASDDIGRAHLAGGGSTDRA